MQKPKAEIVHREAGRAGEITLSEIIIDGTELQCVTDFSIKKSSARQSTELTITIDCGELHEHW